MQKIRSENLQKLKEIFTSNNHKWALNILFRCANDELLQYVVLAEETDSMYNTYCEATTMIIEHLSDYIIDMAYDSKCIVSILDLDSGEIVERDSLALQRKNKDV